MVYRRVIPPRSLPLPCVTRGTNRTRTPSRPPCIPSTLATARSSESAADGTTARRGTAVGPSTHRRRAQRSLHNLRKPAGNLGRRGASRTRHTVPPGRQGVCPPTCPTLQSRSVVCVLGSVVFSRSRSLTLKTCLPESIQDTSKAFSEHELGEDFILGQNVEMANDASSRGPSMVCGPRTACHRTLARHRALRSLAQQALG